MAIIVEIINANKQLSVSKKSCSEYRISMIKAKLSFLRTSNSEGHGCQGNKGTILFLDSVNVLLKSVEYIKSYRYLSGLC